MKPTDSQNLVETFWQDHLAWSDVADRLKRRLYHWRLAVLCLSIAGALFQTLSASPGLVGGAAWVFAIIGTVCLTLVAVFAKRYLTSKATEYWVRARSVSEGIKSVVFWYASRAAPYGGPDALKTLTDQVRSTLEAAEDMALERAKAQPSADPTPTLPDAQAYITQRLLKQKDGYYRPRAKEMAKAAEHYGNAEFWLAVVAAVLGATATALHTPLAESVGAGSDWLLGHWVAVLTTAGAAIAAHAAAGRFTAQATIFLATAARLDRIHQDWIMANRPESGAPWDEIVRQVEETISAEHRGWMAKVSGTDDPDSGTE